MPKIFKLGPGTPGGAWGFMKTFRGNFWGAVKVNVLT